MKKVFNLINLLLVLLCCSCQQKEETIEDFMKKYEYAELDFTRDFDMLICKSTFETIIKYDNDRGILQVYVNNYDSYEEMMGEFVQYVIKLENNNYAVLSISEYGKFVEYMQYSSMEEAFNDLFMYYYDRYHYLDSSLLRSCQKIDFNTQYPIVMKNNGDVYQLLIDELNIEIYVGENFRYISEKTTSGNETNYLMKFILNYTNINLNYPNYSDYILIN